MSSTRYDDQHPEDHRGDHRDDRDQRRVEDIRSPEQAEHTSDVRRAVVNEPTPEQMADPGDLADPNQPSPDTPPVR